MTKEKSKRNGTEVLRVDTSSGTVQPPHASKWHGAYAGKRYEWLKRWLDLTIASLALIVTLPISIAIAIAIRLDSPGPILFKQKRVGRYCKTFTIYKFRTMVADAEKRQKELEAKNEVGGAYFKIKNDPRVTRVGAWLRKTSLDELPQLLNVIKGEMSIVGPRPLPVTGFEHEEWYIRKAAVQPGMTGLWQISGRSKLTGEDAIAIDLEYVDRRSFWFDLYIVFKTLIVILTREGAA